MHDLSAAQLTELESLLRSRKQALMDDVAGLSKEANAKADCTVSDAFDAAALQESRHRAAALISNREHILAEIDAALVRLGQGRYGISESTGEPIPYARLAVVPWARTE